MNKIILTTPPGESAEELLNQVAEYLLKLLR